MQGVFLKQLPKISISLGLLIGSELLARSGDVEPKSYGMGLTYSFIGPQSGVEFQYRFDKRNSAVASWDSSIKNRQLALSFRNFFWKTLYFDLGLAIGQYKIFGGTNSFGLETDKSGSVTTSPGLSFTSPTDIYGYTVERKYLGMNFALGNRYETPLGFDLGIEWAGRTLPLKEFDEKFKFRRTDAAYLGPIENHSKTAATLVNILTIFAGLSF